MVLHFRERLDMNQGSVVRDLSAMPTYLVPILLLTFYNGSRYPAACMIQTNSLDSKKNSMPQTNHKSISVPINK